jgi:hypothetical protein
VSGGCTAIGGSVLRGIALIGDKRFEIAFLRGALLGSGLHLVMLAHHRDLIVGDFLYFVSAL